MVYSCNHIQVVEDYLRSISANVFCFLSNDSVISSKEINIWMANRWQQIKNNDTRFMWVMKYIADDWLLIKYIKINIKKLKLNTRVKRSMTYLMNICHINHIFRHVWSITSKYSQNLSRRFVLFRYGEPKNIKS